MVPNTELPNSYLTASVSSKKILSKQDHKKVFEVLVIYILVHLDFVVAVVVVVSHLSKTLHCTGDTIGYEMY